MPSFNKLVRDNIPEIIRKNGSTPHIKYLNDSEYTEQLEIKLQEEVSEYLADKNGEELADILEVIFALAETLHITPEELEVLRQEKAQARGAFKEKIFLISTED